MRNLFICFLILTVLLFGSCKKSDIDFSKIVGTYKGQTNLSEVWFGGRQDDTVYASEFVVRQVSSNSFSVTGMGTFQYNPSNSYEMTTGSYGSKNTIVFFPDSGKISLEIYEQDPGATAITSSDLKFTGKDR